MHLLCLGVSHKTAAVELRERVAFGEEQAAGFLADLAGEYVGVEFVMISTCNRTELYAARPAHAEPRFDQLAGFLASRCEIDHAALLPVLYHHEGPQAVRHLMRVASGLESMVLGEDQIIGQVRSAYQLAQRAGTVGSVMHRVFQNTLALAKRVRTETELGSGRLSVSSAAVDFARHLFHRFDDKTVLTIGAGKMTELTLEHFARLKPAQVLVANRTAEKAEDLAARFGGRAVPFDRLDDWLIEADVVISSTGSRQPIVTAERFRELLPRRRFRPIFVIDIAVPRDFEPQVGELANVYLYDMDDLQRTIADQAAARSGVLAACESMIEPAVVECFGGVQKGELTDLIVRLRRHLQEIGEQETGRTLNKLRTASAEEQQRLIEEHTHRLINKILHRPLGVLNKGAAESGAAMYAAALRRLFDLDLEPAPGESPVSDPEPSAKQNSPAS